MQAKKFAKFRERKSRVDKDVVRTDRTLPFYAGDDNPNVEALRSILITYSFYNFDLGYCQVSESGLWLGIRAGKKVRRSLGSTGGAYISFQPLKAPRTELPAGMK